MADPPVPGGAPAAAKHPASVPAMQARLGEIERHWTNLVDQIVAGIKNPVGAENSVSSCFGFVG
jgi:hypothetical protein